MKLTGQVTIEDFRQEMQHRVVRYPLNSRPVKEAVRFAKRHQDPAFYRIASDKVHAQRQFQRELNGPSRTERLVDFFTLGSLREVVVTLLLVGVGVLGLDLSKRAMQGDPDTELYSNMDVDALANRLGLVIEESTRVESKPVAGDEPHANGVLIDTDSAQRLSDEDVDRIAEAVIRRLGERSDQANEKPKVTRGPNRPHVGEPKESKETGNEKTNSTEVAVSSAVGGKLLADAGKSTAAAE